MLIEIILYTYTQLLFVFLAIVFLGMTYVLGKFNFKKKKNLRVEQYKTYLDHSNSFIKNISFRAELSRREKAA